MEIQRILPALAATLGAFFSPLTHAEEGGVGHYMPGAFATPIDMPPTKAGWVVEGIYLHYQGDASASRAFPRAGLLTAGLDVTSDAYMLGVLHTFEKPVFGAHYSMGAFFPVVSTEVTGSLTGPAGSLSRTDSVTGFGDLTIIPAMFGWKSGSWQVNALLNVYAPTGEYEVGRLANPGLNYWTFDPIIGFSYSSEKTGFNFGLHTGLTLNTENDDTNYRSGSVSHTELSVTQLLPLGKGYLGIGANAFLYEQVSGDSGSGATLGGFEDSSVGVGPALTYLRAMDGKNFAIEVKWIPEHNTDKRLESNSIWMKIAFQF